jgi:hypothetical protein
MGKIISDGSGRINNIPIPEGEYIINESIKLDTEIDRDTKKKLLSNHREVNK